MHSLKRGDHITYSPGQTGKVRVRGMVRRLHRDGSVTVEARFFLDPDGKDVPGYLGYEYRMDPDHLKRWAGAAT